MEPFVSDRAAAEQRRQDRLKLFDDFIDLALGGVVTLDEAIAGVRDAFVPKTAVGLESGADESR